MYLCMNIRMNEWARDRIGWIADFSKRVRGCRSRSSETRTRGHPSGVMSATLRDSNSPIQTGDSGVGSGEGSDRSCCFMLKCDNDFIVGGLKEEERSGARDT